MKQNFAIPSPRSLTILKSEKARNKKDELKSKRTEKARLNREKRTKSNIKGNFLYFIY